MTTDHDALMMAHLLRELAPHGIDEERITIEYQDDLQDYDVLISGGELTPEQIGNLADATRTGGCVRFSDTRNTDLWHAHLGREGRKILIAQAAEARRQHPDLPRFDRAACTLREFVAVLEVWAGVEPGSTLTVMDDRTVQVQFNGRPDFTAIQKHLAATAVLAAEDIEVILVGSDLPTAD